VFRKPDHKKELQDREKRALKSFTYGKRGKRKAGRFKFKLLKPLERRRSPSGTEKPKRTLEGMEKITCTSGVSLQTKKEKDKRLIAFTAPT